VVAFLKENSRALIIAVAIIAFALIYSVTHRYHAMIDKSRGPSRIVILDRWTGKVTTRY